MKQNINIIACNQWEVKKIMNYTFYIDISNLAVKNSLSNFISNISFSKKSKRFKWLAFKITIWKLCQTKLQFILCFFD